MLALKPSTGYSSQNLDPLSLAESKLWVHKAKKKLRAEFLSFQNINMLGLDPGPALA